MNNLREVFQKYAAVVFFDTETTGLDAKTCQIIELAAIRIEQTDRGTLRMAANLDEFIRLPEGEKLPEQITKLTGITDEMLEKEGLDEADVVSDFEKLLDDTAGPVLLAAHNAQFDLLFTQAMAGRYDRPLAELLARADYLDTLTVYKDRRAYPHKLANAIAAYKLEDKVQNSHRAIDDVAALFEVCKAMDDERADLLEYVNIFGYNPKYGVSGPRIDGVTYWPQRFNKFMQSPRGTDKMVASIPETPTPTPTHEATEAPTFVFMDDEGIPVNWEHLTDAWAAEAGYEKRYTLTDAERLEIAQVITAEAAGEPFAGKVAVAQCILQVCEDEGIRPPEALRRYKYSTRRPEPTPEALEAVEAVFDFGHVATSEPIRYFYAPDLVESSWHESQVYVMTINNHKFFKEAEQ